MKWGRAHRVCAEALGRALQAEHLVRRRVRGRARVRVRARGRVRAIVRGRGRA